MLPGRRRDTVEDEEGVLGAHDVDRAMRELLEEERIAQMGGQILLGFLFAVAYTPAIAGALPDARRLYAWALGVTATAVILLLATVPLHRVNFGHRVRRPVLLVGHVVSLVGLAALAVGIVLSVRLAARFALAEYEQLLTVVVTALVVGIWFVLPAALRVWSASLPPGGDDDSRAPVRRIH